MHEIEVKIEVDDADGARSLLGRCGAVARTPRYFEDNRVYDDRARTLRSGGKLLRLRSVGSRHVITYKEPATGAGDGDAAYKIRVERQTTIGEPEEADAILLGLGYSVVYRYQKYRQAYRLHGASIELDETPLGTFLELEGDPREIDATARALGFSKRSYITKTYRDLHVEAAGSDEPGDLVFEPDGS